MKNVSAQSCRVVVARFIGLGVSARSYRAKNAVPETFRFPYGSLKTSVTSGTISKSTVPKTFSNSTVTETLNKNIVTETFRFPYGSLKTSVTTKTFNNSPVTGTLNNVLVTETFRFPKRMSLRGKAEAISEITHTPYYGVIENERFKDKKK